MRFIVSAGASRFVDVANEHMWRIVSLPLLTPAQQVHRHTLSYTCRFVDVANEHMWRIVSLPLLTPAQQVYTQAHTHVHTHVIHMSYHMSYAWHTRVALECSKPVDMLYRITAATNPRPAGIYTGTHTRAHTRHTHVIPHVIRMAYACRVHRHTLAYTCRFGCW